MGSNVWCLVGYEGRLHRMGIRQLEAEAARVGAEPSPDRALMIRRIMQAQHLTEEENDA